MAVHRREDELKYAGEMLMQDVSAGHVFRVKGFLPKEDGTWLELNATSKEITLCPIENGQEILIVIGEDLVEEKIRAYFQMGGNEK